MTVHFHAEARAELLSGYVWYLDRSVSAADGFMEAVDNAIAQVADHPLRWPEYHLGTRHYVLRRYPYRVVYRVAGDVVTVVAVMHTRRRPDYWAARLRPLQP